MVRPPIGRKGRLRATTALGILALGLAACGSSGPSSSATDPGPVPAPTAQARSALVTAVAHTQTLTAAFSITFTRSGTGNNTPTPLRATGSEDLSGPTTTITLALPGGRSEREQMLFLPGTVFIRPPASSPPLQPGRPWIFANFSDIARYKITFPPYIVQTEFVNPALTESELSSGTQSVSSFGRTTYQGVPATHYRVTVNLNQALSRSTGTAGTAFSGAINSEIIALGGSAYTAPVTLPVDVWVDRSNRIIGLQYTPPGAGIGSLTVSFNRFGATVDAAKPLRATVVDLAGMIPGGEQEALNGGDADGA